MNKETITVGEVKDVNVLSLYDGMSCGMLAFMKAGVQVNNYYAYEIDKYAIQTATHNFPQIQECGDVFKGDYTQYEGIDYLIGGKCLHLLVNRSISRQTRDNSKWIRLGFIQSVCKSFARSETKIFHIRKQQVDVKRNS